MNFKYISMLIVTALLSIASLVGAEETTTTPEATPESTPAASTVTGPTISGYIDSTYNNNFSGGQYGSTTPLRSYDYFSNTFLLNAVHIALNGSTSPELKYTVEVDHGTDAVLNHSGPSFGASVSTTTADFFDSMGNTKTAVTDVSVAGSGVPATNTDIQEAYVAFSPALIPGITLYAGAMLYDGIETGTWDTPFDWVTKSFIEAYGPKLRTIHL